VPASVIPRRAEGRVPQSRTSRFLLPGNAISLRSYGSFNDLATVIGNELGAVAALLVSVGLIPILHRSFGGFLRKRFFACHHASNQRATHQQRSALHNRAAGEFRIVFQVQYLLVNIENLKRADTREQQPPDTQSVSESVA